MIGSLFRLGSVAKDKDDAEKASGSHVYKKTVAPVKPAAVSPHEEPFVAPRNLDQLSVAVRKLLMDQNLEVSKVRPFFWSMVEAYLDRFHIYPFDVVKALFSYIESEECSAEELKELVRKLEDYYQQQHGEPMHKPVTRRVFSNDDLDDEIKQLRESIKYASLVGELREKA